MKSIKIFPIKRVARVLLVILLLVIADYGIGSLMCKFYFRQESGDSYLLTYAIDSTKADIIILGSSRAKHSYVPSIFQENLNMSCFNAGRDGTEHILFNYAQFTAITTRYSPKIIIFDIRPEDLIYNASEYDMLSPLMPYYKTHREIRYLINIRSPFERLKHLSTIYPFNSLIFQIIMGNLEMNKERKPHENGYIPFHGSKLTNTLDTLQTPVYPIDTYKTAIIKKLMLTCKEKEIYLVLIYSPTYNIVKDNYYQRILDEICEENGIEYLNFSNVHEILMNPDLFFDRTHLNDDGARQFSGLVSTRLETIFEKQ
jgi:hypothetical protein